VKENMPKKTAVIGAGSWGTTLAIHAAKCGHDVSLWVHSQDTLKALIEKKTNEIYLPGIILPDNVQPTSDPGCVVNADYIIFAVPSLHFRKTFSTIMPDLRDQSVLISSIKGMEPDTSLRISEIVRELSQDRFIFSVLSGPSFAKEVAQQNPTAVVIGSENKEVGKEIQNDFSSKYFRLYYNSDVLGIEIGGCVKNIIAIAAGVVSGLGYGYNTLSGLITRGLAEVNRLAVNLGANPATLMGLAGLGDLVLTCTGHLSRNRQVGVELGQGKNINEITRNMRMVAEGIRTTQGIYALAKKRNMVMPITEQVQKVLYEGHDPRTAILELMSRELKEE
jgi:glycerol-3-phosphate dehydrogenase (NAD(P)+)